MLCAILDVNMCSPERSETTQTCGRGNNHQPSPLDHIQFSGTGYGVRPVAWAIKIKHAGLNPEDWAMTQSLQGVLIPDSVKTGTKLQASSLTCSTG